MKGSRKKIRKFNSVVTIPSENEDANINSYGVKKSHNNVNNQSCIEENDLPDASTIAECLGYAKDVSGIFSQTIIQEKQKWKNVKDGDEGKVDEDVVWKHAKRVARMIAIQRKNLDHLVELVADNVAKDCPSYNVAQLKGIAKIGSDTPDISSSACKGKEH